MLVFAALGLGVALYCLDGVVSLGSARPDRLLDLPSVRSHVGHFLHRLAFPGSTAGLALLCGLGAVGLGLLLLVGTLRSPKQRLAVLERDSEAGMLAARPRTLGAMSRALAEQADGATSVRRPKLRLSRRGTRGKLKVTASQTQTSERSDVRSAIEHELGPISAPFKLRPRVRVRAGGQGERVQ